MLCIRSYFILNVIHLPLLNHCPHKFWLLFLKVKMERMSFLFRFLECLRNLHVSTYREEKKQITVAFVFNIFAASGMIK